MGLFDIFRSTPATAPVSAEPVASPALRQAIEGERQKRSATISTEETNSSFIQAILGYGGTVGGVPVNERTALGLSAVYACVNDISQDIAGLPYHVYQDVDAGRIKVKGHPTGYVLNRKANPKQNSFQFRQSMAATVLLHGNAYAQIERNGRQQLAALHYKHPDKTTVYDLNGRLWYRFDGDPKVYPDYEVIHLRGLSLDGVLGMSPLRAHREIFGKTLNAQKTSGKFYENGAQLSGVLETDQQFKDPAAAARIRDNFNSLYAGADNAGRVAVLENGLKFKALSMPPADAQYIEQAKLGRSEVCAIFRMPPHKIGDLERSTNNNIEQQSLDYTGDTLMPWLISFEQEYNLKLFTSREQIDYEGRHNIDALMRADAAARAAFYGKMTDIGAYSINDVLALEDRPGIGENGDARFVQVNRWELSQAIAGKPEPQPSTTPDNVQDPATA